MMIKTEVKALSNISKFFSNFYIIQNNKKFALFLENLCYYMMEE